MPLIHIDDANTFLFNWIESEYFVLIKVVRHRITDSQINKDTEILEQFDQFCIEGFVNIICLHHQVVQIGERILLILPKG